MCWGSALLLTPGERGCAAQHLPYIATNYTQLLLSRRAVMKESACLCVVDVGFSRPKQNPVKELIFLSSFPFAHSVTSATQM